MKKRACTSRAGLSASSIEGELGEAILCDGMEGLGRARRRSDRSRSDRGAPECRLREIGILALGLDRLELRAWRAPGSNTKLAMRAGRSSAVAAAA